MHGRLRKPEVGVASGYVISSADFGRAYLSEGWATRFVKALRERYTIVLLGYRAEDPPMRYLLEGLNAADGVSYNSPIYAFTQGDEGMRKKNGRIEASHRSAIGRATIMRDFGTRCLLGQMRCEIPKNGLKR
ncbi:hypothetical protein E6W36_10255 [Hankyongella ginsenosidimutans]|uniref:Uncharacterized protein n=1 Tax=Hankyongella ginsenosidimutans TaxID=1763828 RepID=A0A4D7C731_9SPHN|nr:hypothetical protein E6W36_10255 [Hankyongella ginsenosidimutans]